MKKQNTDQRNYSLDRYLSYESALYVRGCLSQTIYKEEYASVSENNLGRGIHNIPKSHFFGFDEDGIAEPEKALLDLIYRESQKGKAGIFYLHQIFHDIDWEELSIQKLDKYAKRMDINWRKYLPEKTDSRHPELAELIRESFKQ
ncbi:hypothetical protein DRJ16_00420 [Candidatus Woesearchaeota archaeon]|nr:MAG: hypothetical protein DRJ16_00420 [Candidatus Woesearchaeota archaeon]